MMWNCFLFIDGIHVVVPSYPYYILNNILFGFITQADAKMIHLLKTKLYIYTAYLCRRYSIGITFHENLSIG
jgi:hypothetical protein